jgi:endonuclease/exonuclease/phosphatase family metal-dependent hydrolase
MHKQNYSKITRVIFLIKFILLLLFLVSCTSVDYILLNTNKIDSKSDIGIITFNIKAIYEKEEFEIDDLMKIINNGKNDFVVFQELFDESTREKIIEKANRNNFNNIIARVDYNSFPEFIFQDAGLFMMSKYPRIDLSDINFGCDVENSEGVIHTILEKEMSSTNDFLANKSVAGALFDVDDENKIFLFTAHVQAAGTLEHKLFQLEQIGKFIETAVQKVITEKIVDSSEDLAVILAGDFNSNAYDLDRFNSLLVALKYPRDLHKEFHGVNEEYTFRNRTRRYDYIFSYDKINEFELKKININSIGVLDIKTSRNESISDHLAIKASLDFRNIEISNQNYEIGKE